MSKNTATNKQEELTAVEAAFVRTRLVLVRNIGAAILICVAGVVVPTSISAQANIAEQTAGGLAGVCTRHQVTGSPIFCACADVALLLCMGEGY